MSESMTHNCGDHLERTTRVREIPIHGTRVPVDEEYFRCTECGEEEYSYDQATAAERRAAEVFRERNGFLQPDEIAALRRRWGVTQTQLEDALGLGRKTVARWEAGRVLQTRALDNLLRVIDQFPSVLTFLAQRQGASISPRAEWHPGAPGADPGHGLPVPRSLLTRLEEEAREEGTSLELYAVAILAQGLERRSTNREIERLHRKLDETLADGSPWKSGAMEVNQVEPWLREHHEQQRSRAPQAVAF